MNPSTRMSMLLLLLMASSVESTAVYVRLDSTGLSLDSLPGNLIDRCSRRCEETAGCGWFSVSSAGCEILSSPLPSSFSLISFTRTMPTSATCPSGSKIFAAFGVHPTTTTPSSSSSSNPGQTSSSIAEETTNQHPSVSSTRGDVMTTSPMDDGETSGASGDSTATPSTTTLGPKEPVEPGATSSSSHGPMSSNASTIATTLLHSTTTVSASVTEVTNPVATSSTMSLIADSTSSPTTLGSSTSTNTSTPRSSSMTSTASEASTTATSTAMPSTTPTSTSTSTTITTESTGTTTASTSTPTFTESMSSTSASSITTASSKTTTSTSTPISTSTASTTPSSTSTSTVTTTTVPTTTPSSTSTSTVTTTTVPTTTPSSTSTSTVTTTTVPTTTPSSTSTSTVTTTTAPTTTPSSTSTSTVTTTTVPTTTPSSTSTSTVTTTTVPTTTPSSTSTSTVITTTVPTTTSTSTATTTTTTAASPTTTTPNALDNFTFVDVPGSNVSCYSEPRSNGRFSTNGLCARNGSDPCKADGLVSVFGNCAGLSALKVVPESQCVTTLSYTNTLCVPWESMFADKVNPTANGVLSNQPGCPTGLATGSTCTANPLGVSMMTGRYTDNLLTFRNDSDESGLMISACWSYDPVQASFCPSGASFGKPYCEYQPNSSTGNIGWLQTGGIHCNLQGFYLDINTGGCGYHSVRVWGSGGERCIGWDVDSTTTPFNDQLTTVSHWFVWNGTVTAKFDTVLGVLLRYEDYMVLPRVLVTPV